MKRLCFVLLLVASVASAQLTQSQVEAAVRNALMAVPVSYVTGTGVVTMPNLFPNSSLTLGEYLYYTLTGQPAASGLPIRTILEQIRDSAYSSTNELFAISGKLDSIDSTLSRTSDIVEFIQFNTSDSAATLAGIGSSVNSMAFFVDSILNRFYDLSSQLAEFTNQVGNASSEFVSSLSDILDDLSVVVDYAYQITYQIDESNDYLYYIRQDTDDILQGVGAIDNILRAIFDNGILEINNQLDAIAALMANLDFEIPEPLDVSVVNWPGSFAVSGFDGFASNLLGEVSAQGTNIQTIADLLPDWFVNATNFYGQFIVTPEIESETAFQTNAVITNAVIEAARYDDEFDSLTNQLDSLDILREVTKNDPQLINPWDGASSVGDNLEHDVLGVFDTPDPSFTTEVILMGSNDMNLPRIAFDVEDLYSRSYGLSLTRQFFTGLWLVVGLIIKFTILKSFWAWLAKRGKK